jgi:hypothetical protein
MNVLTLILFIMALTLASAITALFLYIGREPNTRRDMFYKYFGGSSYIGIGTLGLAFSGQFSEFVALKVIFAIVFLLIGIWMIESGRKIARDLKQKN